MVEPVTPEIASRLDLKSDFGGLVVREVTPDGPAADRGQLLGIQDPNGPDIITAVEGTEVRTERDLRRALKAVGSGNVATLTLYNASAGARRLLRIRVR
jgi:S1-C subfamily serine protease